MVKDTSRKAATVLPEGREGGGEKVEGKLRANGQLSVTIVFIFKVQWEAKA